MTKILYGKEPSTSSKEIAKLEEKAYNVILLSLSNGVLRKVVDKEAVPGLWMKLESLYMKKFPTNRFYFKKWLYTLKMKEHMPICDHLDEFIKIIIDMKNIDIKVDNKYQTLIVLCSLLGFYDNFINLILCGKFLVGKL